MIFLRNKNRQRALIVNSVYSTRANVNERLASMGGLFGFLSIVVTGALLYAIFTAKSEDKWYYITAVLINIILLILLMIGAIAFDRFYIKRWTTRRLDHTSTIRTVNMNPSAACTSQDQHELFDSSGYSCINDIPPMYPGFTAEASTRQLNGQCRTSAEIQCFYLDLDRIQPDDSEKQKKSQPPNYHELYPSDDQKPLETSDTSQMTKTNIQTY
jgi:hypothetical protein